MLGRSRSKGNGEYGKGPGFCPGHCEPCCPSSQTRPVCWWEGGGEGAAAVGAAVTSWAASVHLGGVLWAGSR